jgi:hypothetical protein
MPQRQRGAAGGLKFVRPEATFVEPHGEQHRER